MIRMSKKLNLGALAVTLGLLLLALIPLLGFVLFSPGSKWLYETLGTTDSWQTANILILSLVICAAALFLVVQVVITLRLLYKMWAAIQDGRPRTTPAKAIGYLFIPFFSVYWIFQVWGGCPADYNSYVGSHRSDLPRLNSGIYVAYPVLILLSAIPFLNILTVFVSLFVFFAIITKTCDAVNRLADVTQGQIRSVPQINAYPKRAAG
jgi:hypothetical protein